MSNTTQTIAANILLDSDIRETLAYEAACAGDQEHAEALRRRDEESATLAAEGLQEQAAEGNRGSQHVLDELAARWGGEA